MDEQRAEFEAWASHFFTRGELDRHGINGARPDEYRVLHIERMWGAWQAATQRQQERIAELQAALQVMLRDYAAVHDIGDVEMQPAIYQARAAIARATHKEQT